MIANIISIVLSSTLSLIAVVISVIAIKKQTKSQNINANIQLFDKRYQIHQYVYDMWVVVGYFESLLDNANYKHTYVNIIKLLQSAELSNEIKEKINNAYENSEKYEMMSGLLFSGRSAEYLKEILPLFTIYINGIHHKYCLFEKISNDAYKQIFAIYKTENFGMNDLNQFLDLSDVKRLDK